MSTLDPNSVNVVIYHADCTDGFGAAYSAMIKTITEKIAIQIFWLLLIFLFQHARLRRFSGALLIQN